MRTKVIMLLLLVSGMAEAQNGRIEQLDPQAFDAKMKHIKHTLIDLRHPDVFELGCIQGAINIAWPGKEGEAVLGALKKYEPVYIYSGDGTLCEKLAAYLTQNGFSNVVILTGGFEAWKNKGLKIVFPTTKR